MSRGMEQSKSFTRLPLPNIPPEILTELADAENVVLVGDRIEPAEPEGSGSSGDSEGKGKRRRVANQRYAAFWRHYDEDSYLEDHDKK